MSNDCVFCQIVAGESPAKLVPCDNPGMVAFPPRGGVGVGHMLFVPRDHATDASTSPILAALAFWEASRYARDMAVPFNLITSAGPAATQSVFHLHVHYVPRAEGDGLLLPWGDNTTHTAQAAGAR